MKLVGMLLVIFGLADAGLRLFDVFVWDEIGIRLPDELAPWTPFPELLLGYLMIKFGTSSDDDPGSRPD